MRCERWSARTLQFSRARAHPRIRAVGGKVFLRCSREVCIDTMSVRRRATIGIHIRFFSVCCLLITTGSEWCDAFGADMYKWTDDAGRVHYSDRPPDLQPKDLSRQPIPSSPAPSPRSSPAETPSSAVEQWERTWERRKREIEERREQARKKKDAAKSQRRREACDKARAVLAADQTRT